MVSNYLQSVEQNREDMLRFFEELHSFPELGYEEKETSEKLARMLESAGFEVERNVGGTTGVIGTLRGKEPGVVLAIRSDMDALPIEEKSGHPNPSRNPGVMHACGHDAHMTIVLYTALIAARTGIRRGTLKVVFQPAEELLTGALSMLKSGSLEDVEEMVGLHLRPIQEAKLGEASPSLIHGSAYMVTVSVEGKSAHGARPHLGVNAADAAALIVQNINSIRVDPRVSHSFKTTSITAGGKAPNIIPESATLTVDVRAQSNDTMKDILEKIENAVLAGAQAVGAKGVLEKVFGVPSPEYDEKLVGEMRIAIEEVLGNSLPPIVSPGAEDFHYYATEGKIRTAYMALGANLEPGLHSEKMRFDPEAIITGTKIMTTLVAGKLID